MNRRLLAGMPINTDIKKLVSPTTIVGLFLLGYLALILVQNGGDPLVFVRLGAGFVEGVPVDETNLGYDGQFFYYIALDPTPDQAAQHLDIPAYRYQRIFYPLLVRVLAFGQPAVIPWMLVFVNWGVHVLGTGLLGKWLVQQGMSRWYALTYGLWFGLIAAARLDLAEPLCYALIIAAWWAYAQGRYGWVTVFLGFALFTKETAVFFLAACLLAALFERRWVWLGFNLVPLSLFALFQGWLYLTFGSFGLGSGGYQGTAFEMIPFMGLWRVARLGWPIFFAFFLLMGIPVVLPSLWGLMAAARRLMQRDFSPTVWALALNAAVIPFTPFSTFIEPSGMFRFVIGLILSTLFFAVRVKSTRVLNYSLFWIAALALLTQG